MPLCVFVSRLIYLGRASGTPAVYTQYRLQQSRVGTIYVELPVGSVVSFRKSLEEGAY